MLSVRLVAYTKFHLLVRSPPHYTLTFTTHIPSLLKIAFTSCQDWLLAKQLLDAGRGESSPGSIRAYSYNLFPLPPALSWMVAAVSCAAVISNMVPCVLGVLLAAVPAVAQYASFITIDSSDTSTQLDVSRIAIQIIIINLLLAGAAYMRISSQRRTFSLLLSVQEQFELYTAAVKRWRDTQHMAVAARERMAKATTAHAVGQLTMGYLSHQLRNPLHFLSLILTE